MGNSHLVAVILEELRREANLQPLEKAENGFTVFLILIAGFYKPHANYREHTENGLFPHELHHELSIS